jgi:transcriptional regulator GlxA family with amidase domain
MRFADSHANRIARAVSVIRAEHGETLPVEHLAEVAGMSIWSLH